MIWFIVLIVAIVLVSSMLPSSEHLPSDLDDSPSSLKRRNERELQKLDSIRHMIDRQSDKYTGI